MRKIIFCTLTGIVFINLLSFYVAYRVTQQEMVKAVEETAAINEPQESGSMFQLTKADYDSLAWIRSGKAFKFNGRVFDVLQIVINDSSVQLYVEEDKSVTAEATKTVSAVSFRQS